MRCSWFSHVSDAWTERAMRDQEVRVSSQLYPARLRDCWATPVLPPPALPGSESPNVHEEEEQ